MQPTVVPDKDWYARRSTAQGVSIRCPFANVEHCYRYYDSLSLMGQAGATEIPEKEDARLLKKWKKTGLYPATRELSTSISGPPGNPDQFANYCPEVTLEFSGVAASYLSKYADEIDRDNMHRMLTKHGMPTHDPRWRWSSTSEMHYSDCPAYSILLHRSKEKPQEQRLAWWEWAKRVGIAAGGIAGVWAAIKKMFF